MKRIAPIQYFLFYIMCVLGFTNATAQQGTIKKADAAFAEKNYSAASMLYEDAINNTKDKKTEGYLCYKIAECYYYTHNYPKAIQWYKRAEILKYKDQTKTMYFNYGNMLMMAGEYAQAKKMFKTHLSKSPRDQYARIKMNSCDWADTMRKQQTDYYVRNIQELNTKYNDFAPAFYKGKVLFTSSPLIPDAPTYTVTGEGFEDLYETELDQTTDLWAAPKMVKEINTSYNDGTFSFDQNRNIGYFMQCNGAKGVEKNCNIYTADYDEATDTWSKPKKFVHYSTKYSSGHPTVSPDGNTLYFASNNPAGMGGTDIWVVKRLPETEKWGKPKNVGAPINTPFEEMFPYTFDGQGLYFSSNGHTGLGGLDIYYSELIDTSFAEPINLKLPFNSSADDFGLMFLTGNSGMFSSNRAGGVGGDDLYYFSLKRVEITATGKVTNAELNEPIENAIVVVRNNVTQACDTLVTDEQGIYTYSDMQKDMDYTFTSFKSDFLNPEKKWISTMGIHQDTYMDSLHGYDLNFKLQKIVEGKEYEIKDIYYDLDKYTLRPESIAQLDNIVTIMNNNPEICIQINSHTDSRADDEYNRQLSNNRAKAVVDYMISKNISSKRLAWQGWGETKLLIPNAQTEEEHQMNRRTTFTIVNIDELHLGEKAVFHNKITQRYAKKTNEEPAEKGTYFRLQIAAARTPCTAKTFARIEQAFPNFPTFCMKHPDGFYKYTVGSFKTFDNAEQAKKDIDNLGYKSFIVAYNNGKRISINEALTLLKVYDKAFLETND